MLLSDFGITPHPYGVQPSGNAYVKDDNDTTTIRNQIHSLLPEEIWQKVLSFCDGPSLSRVVQTCREFYIAGHQPELWRDLVLRDVTEGEGGKLLNVGDSWKDTFAQRLVHNDKVSPHVPMAIPGIYSDFYFRTHICRSFGFPSSWLKPSKDKNNVVVRVKKDISVSEFLSRFENPNQPVVLAGVAKSWPAVKKWDNANYLMDCTRKKTFRATSGAAPFGANFSINSYLRYCHYKNLEEAPLYLFDRTALLEGPLREDYYSHLQQTCPYFDPEQADMNGGHDLFQYLGEGRRPDHTWLIMGPKRSGSAFHMDPNATHAWNAAIVGRKRWIFYPPGVVPPGIHPSPSGDEVAMPISIGEWLVNYWEEHQRRRVACGALECTVEAGDVVFVPHGWWHMVINLDDINIAITHNYVSKSNLSTVLRFLEKKQEQISGCRDRSDAIQPQHLYNEFTAALREAHPKVLEEAQAAAKQGWTCRAWTDATNDENENASNGPTTRILCKRKRQRTETPTASKGKSVMSRAKVAPAENSAQGGSSGFSFSFL